MARIDLEEAERRIWSDPVVQRVANEASRRGLKVYLVGGAVRDHILGRPHKDYDFVLERLCASFLKSLGTHFETRYFPLGREEKVYRIVKEDKVLDFTPMVGKDIMEDLLRRDFTINAIAYCPQQRKFYSHPRSLEDLRKGLLSPLSPQALEDDPLRILRGFRYMATLGFEMVQGLKLLIEEKKGLLREVAPERILMEMDEILLSSRPGRALRAMAETGVLEVVLPELSPLRDVPPGTPRERDAFYHSLSVCSLALEEIRERDRIPLPEGVSLGPEDLLVLGYGALLHDLGKADALSFDEKGRPRFHGHESLSAAKAQGIMERYPFSRDRKKRVLRLISNHMRPLNLLKTGATERALRRLAFEMGDDLPLLMTLAFADTEEKGEDPSGLLSLARRALEVMRRIKEAEAAPLIRGRDLLEMGFTPGPHLGEILRRVKDLQIEGSLKNREEALQYVKKTYQIS